MIFFSQLVRPLTDMGGQIQRKSDLTPLIEKHLEKFVSKIPRSLKFTPQTLMAVNYHLPFGFRFTMKTLLRVLRKMKHRCLNNIQNDLLLMGLGYPCLASKVSNKDIITI